MNMTERWQPVRGYEGRYEVSSHGLVRSIYREIRNSIGRLVRRKGRLLKPALHAPGGYLKVSLCKESECTSFFVHRLVAVAFIDNPCDLPEVNHCDFNRLNNTRGNLEWCTKPSNLDHARRNGRYSAATNPNVAMKLTAATVEEIKAAIASGERQCRVAERFGVSESTVSDIKLNKTWLKPNQLPQLASA